MWFYFAYIHCSNILKDSLHYTTEAVIHQTFIISIVEFFVALALTYVISSFGLVYLTERLNNLGLLMIVIPIIIGYSLGISHFKKLEVEVGNIIEYKRRNVAFTFYIN